MAGVLFLAAALFITPIHGFMDIDSSLTGDNIIIIAALAAVPFAVTQFLRVVQEIIKRNKA
jgi:hypothetical protein